MPKHRKTKPDRAVECCQRDDHTIITPPKPAVKQVFEPCPVCHNDVGVVTPENITETWSVLPCGHRFGDYCLKVWLGMSKDAICPICRKRMMHACGHPTLPRPTTAPEPEPEPEPDVTSPRSEKVGPSASLAHGDGPAADVVHEKSAGQGEKKGSEIVPGNANTRNNQASSSRISPKNAVRVAAQRVRSFHQAVRMSFTDGAESEAPSGAAVDSSGHGPAQITNPAPPMVQQPPRTGLFEGALSASSPLRPAGRRRRRRRRLRRRGSRSPRAALSSPAAAAATAATASGASAAPGSELLQGSSQAAILGMLASQSHVQPANAPQFFQMAYPKEVDLTLPCAYCYLTMYREPEDSPYRGGSGSGSGIGNVFGGNAYDIARAATTIKAASMIAIRFFFKNLTPGSLLLKMQGIPSGEGVGETALNQPETILLAAYWDSWRQVNGKAFGQWWAEQEPRTEPAVEAVAEGWNLANMY